MDILIYLMILGVIFVILTINQLTQHNKRFQESNKLEQLWRRRYYLSIPFEWFYSLIMNGNLFKKIERRILWDLLIGLAQGKMKWWYTSEEVKEKFEKYKEEYKKDDI